MSVYREQQQIIDRVESDARTTRFLRLMVGGLAATLLTSMILNATLVFAIRYWYPVKEYLWTSDAQAVCHAVPLAEPITSAARIREFATNAAVSLYSFDYLNWRRLLDAAMDNYLTPGGKARYRAAFEKTGIIERVRSGFLTLTAVTDGPPVILHEGVQDGRYYWRVQVALRVFWVNATDARPENRVLTMTLIRVQPSPINPNGVAIDGIEATQATSSSQVR